MTTQRDISARLDRAAAGARAADRVIARMDERQEARDRETMRKDFEWSIYRQCDREDAEEEQQVSCGHEQAQADAHLKPVQTGRATAGIHLAPTEAERAVDKHWPKYFAEWAKLQQAANGIAVKEKS